MPTAVILLTVTVSAVAILHRLTSIHDHIIEHFERITKMSAVETIAAVVAELDKARGEIVARIADLQAQIAAGTPSEQLDLSALVAAAQALDDVVPDVPVVDPAPADPGAGATGA